MAIDTSDVITWQDFNEGSGDTLTSEASDAQTMTNTGASWTADDPGSLYSSLDYDGSNDFGTYSSPQTGVCTFSIWIKSDTTTPGYFTDQSAGTVGFQLYFNASQQLVCWTRSGTVRRMITTRTSWSADTWYHIVIIVDDVGNSAIWVDNSSEALGTDEIGVNLASLPYNASSTWYIGEYQSGAARWDGHIAQIVLFNRALTSAEISDLYNSGAGKSYAAYFSAPAAVDTNGEHMLLGVNF